MLCYNVMENVMLQYDGEGSVPTGAWFGETSGIATFVV